MEKQICLDLLLDFLKSKEKYFLLTGKAGTGKTTIISNFLKQKEIIKIGNIAVCTLSHRAKNVIKEKVNTNNSNINFLSIAQLLSLKLNLETGEYENDPKGDANKISNYNLIIIDECSMIDAKTRKDIEKRSKKNCKIIYCGDFRQLPPIKEESSPLLNEKFKYSFELKERVRQNKYSDILDYSDLYGEYIINKTPFKVNRIDTNDLKFRKDIYQTIIEYKDDFILNESVGNNIRVCCYRNSTKEAVNLLIRETIFDKVKGLPYQVGDIIILEDNYNPEYYIVEGDYRKYYGSSLLNSSEYIITDCKLKSDVLNTVEYLYWHLEVKSVELSINYTFYVIHEDFKTIFQDLLNDIFKKYLIKKDKEILRQYWDIRNHYIKVSHNFCNSAHKLQGSTYEKIILLEDDIIASNMSFIQKCQCMYVGITRASKQVITIKK